MSNNVPVHNNFGSLDFIVEVYKSIGRFTAPTPFEDIKSFLRAKNKPFYTSRSIDAVIDLFKYLGMAFTDNGNLITNYEKYRMGENSKTKIQSLVIFRIFHQLFLDKVISEVFEPSMIKYDEYGDCFYVDPSSIPIKYSWLRNALITLGFFEFVHQSGLLLISNTYFSFFSNNVLGRLKEFNPSTSESTPITFEEFSDLQNLKDLFGRQAEEFVLNFEKNRLILHPRLDKVKIISNIDVGAGYDIVSYMASNSEILDRLIEVKSFSGACHFFWTRNEIEKAKSNKQKYFLYLVDRKFIDLANYKPIIICNPFDEIFNNSSWLMEPEIWSVSKITFGQ